MTQAAFDDPLTRAEQRLRDLLADGVALDQLSPDEILGGSAALPGISPGLEAANAQAFIRTLRSRASRTDRQLFVAANNLGAFLPEPSHVVPDELGAAIAEQCGRAAETQGVFVLVEERPVRGRLPEFVCPEQTLRLVVGRPALYTQVLAVQGVGRAYDPAARRDEQALRLDGIPVAARQGEGLTQHVRLYAHPFLDGGELAVPGGAADLLARLVALVAPARGGQEAQRLETVRQALQLLPQIAQVIHRSLPDRVAEIDSRLADTDRQLRDTQQRLVDLLATQRALRSERQLVEREQASLSQETVLRALRESARIAALPAVRSVSVAERNRAAQLRVQLHPVVVEHDAHHYLCRHLVFNLPLADPNAESISWEDAPGTASPHPHISSAGSTCWGAAQQEVATALRGGELARAVVLISGWARLYNHSSPYTSLEHFPLTELAPGFHPELED